MTSRILSALVGTALLSGVPMGAALGADELSDWRDKAAREFSSSLTYPRSALRERISGTVRVRVVVDASGVVTGFDIVESSGHVALDRTTIQVLARVSPLDPLPAGQDSYSFIVPLGYRYAGGANLEAAVDGSDDTPATASLVEWREMALKQISGRQTYPDRLLQLGTEGSVRMRVTVGADGRITRDEVAESSGNYDIDRLARRIIGGISRLPALPEGVSSTTVIVPLSWKIAQ